MTELVIVACIAIAALVGGLGGTLLAVIRSHNVEREQWQIERKVMLDRIVARHTAEVVALDREQRLREVPPEPKPERVRPIAEGL